MLPHTGLCNDPSLPQPLHKKGLTNRIVDLVRTHVVHILPLQIHLEPSSTLARIAAHEPLRKAKQALATYVLP